MGSSPFIIATFTAIAILGSLHSLSMIGIEIYRVMDRSTMITNLEQELFELRAEESELEAVIANKGDNAYHEQLARCIGYAYPNEDRFVTINSSQPITPTNCQ